MISESFLKKAFGLANAPDGAMVRDNFLVWFGASKITSASGVPLRVFHITGSHFQSFDTSLSDLGAHFGTQAQADQRTPPRGNADANMIVAYLSIQNPIRLKDIGSFHADGVALQLEKKGILPKGEGKRMHKAADANWRLRKEFNPHIKAVLKAAGFDGVVYANAQEGNGDSYIAFDPAQIKSVYGNSGAFSRLDPDFCDQAALLSAELQARAEKARNFLDVASLRLPMKKVAVRC